MFQCVAFWTTSFRAIPLSCFSPLSCSFNMFISIPCSLNFPISQFSKQSSWVNVVRSFDSVIVVTFGYHDLSKPFRTLMFNSSLSKVFSRPMRLFTMCVNLFCTSAIVSFFYILKSSYSSINACFLTLSHSLSLHVWLQICPTFS